MLIDQIKEIISNTELKPTYQSDYRNIIEGLSSHDELNQYRGASIDNWNLSNPFFKEFVFDKFSRSGTSIDRFTIDPDRVYIFENERFTLRNNFVLLNYNNKSINFFNNDGFSFYTLLNDSIQYAGDSHLLQDLLDKYQMDQRADKVPETSKIKYQKTKSTEKPDEKIEVKPEVIANTMVNKSKSMAKGARFK